MSSKHQKSDPRIRNTWCLRNKRLHRSLQTRESRFRYSSRRELTNLFCHRSPPRLFSSVAPVSFVFGLWLTIRTLSRRNPQCSAIRVFSPTSEMTLVQSTLKPARLPKKSSSLDQEPPESTIIPDTPGAQVSSWLNKPGSHERGSLHRGKRRAGHGPIAEQVSFSRPGLV